MNVPMVQAPPGLALEADEKNPLLGEKLLGSSTLGLLQKNATVDGSEIRKKPPVMYQTL